jgi:hypothetical protein
MSYLVLPEDNFSAVFLLTASIVAISKVDDACHDA